MFRHPCGSPNMAGSVTCTAGRWPAGPGHYRVAPASPRAKRRERSVPQPNVRITRFLSPEGVGEVQDFMPVDSSPQQLARRVVTVRGSMTYRLELEPRFHY